MIPLDSFVGQRWYGKMVPIIPGGNSIPLTFSNRKEYVERAIEYRLHREMDRQVRGNILERFTWEVWEVCFWLQIGACLVFTEFWCMSSRCWLICIYISVLFRDFSGHISGSALLRALGEPWIGQCLAGRPNPHHAFRTCLLTRTLPQSSSSSHLTHGPVSCSSSVRSMWMSPEDGLVIPWGPLSSRSCGAFLVT